VLSRYSSLRSAKKALMSAHMSSTTANSKVDSATTEMADIRVNYASALAENNHVRKVLKAYQ
jgi:hypothetical protein